TLPPFFASRPAMNTSPSPALMAMITVAADLRAVGASWAAVAEKVQRSPETCRTWPRLYPEAWRRLLAQAEDRLTEEAGGEARTYLRKLLRSEDERIVLGAGKLLLGVRTARRAVEDRIDPPPEQDLREHLEFVKYLKGLGDEQVKRL